MLTYYQTYRLLLYLYYLLIKTYLYLFFKYFYNITNKVL